MRKCFLFIMVCVGSFASLFGTVLAESELTGQVQEFLSKMNKELVAAYGAKISNEYFELSKMKPYEVAIGVDYNAVSLVSIDLLKIGFFAITGREASGKTNMLRIIFNHLFYTSRYCL